MKEVLILSDNFLPRHDGVVRFLLEVIPFLKKHFSLTLVVPKYKDKEVDIPGVRIVYIPVGKKFVGDFPVPKYKPLTIVKEIKRADIIFSQTLGPIGGLGQLFAKLLHKPVASYIHSIEWELVVHSKEVVSKKKILVRLVKRLVKFILSSNKVLIVPSERLVDVLNWQGIQTPKQIVHLAVDAHRFSPQQDTQLREMERKRLHIGTDDLVIGYHGRLAYEKDIQTLLRGFVKLRKKYDNVKLLIIGSGVPKLEELIKNQPGVIHIEATSDVEHYLKLMDIYALTSLTETTSLSTLEAMSTGLPVVATPVGFVKDYVKEGVTGYFFTKKDSQDLFLKLELLVNHPHKRNAMGMHARKSVTEQFSWEQTGERVAQMLKNIQRQGK
jgi:glycosyltransferase involved in cell wall biosynthesis